MLPVLFPCTNTTKSVKLKAKTITPPLLLIPRCRKYRLREQTIPDSSELYSYLQNGKYSKSQ